MNNNNLAVKDLIAVLSRAHPDAVTNVASASWQGNCEVELRTQAECDASEAKDLMHHYQRKAESERKRWEQWRTKAEKAGAIILRIKQLKKQRPLPLP